ncbi:hypothetical protein DFH08DRAFT_949001 [Mycena albidolilacea]|uniref:Uncharacterized protein n=1 Tax=Mycena albidolilacea TaxID=1033008 RepID=A0AAD7AT27_9AGAR|nr:hypothetical protein DFH08DRAFT_949001 [Mycena albidolilacea]
MSKTGLVLSNGTRPLDCLREVDSATLADINTNIVLAGALFINQSADHNVAQYVRNLFPLLGTKESNAAASLYESLWSSVDLQFNAILGESTFVCPTYLLLNALPGKAYKRIRDPPRPARRRHDQLLPRFDEFGSVLHFNNSAFITAFTQGFVSFAAHLDPNAKLRPSIAPVCRRWSRGAQTELVFNQTESGAPYIAPSNTSSALLERCE